jgi:DNA sulfur modification protein DndB
MSFLKQIEIDSLKDKLVSDPSTLGKLYKAKKNEFVSKSVDHSLVDNYLKEGWTIQKELKTKTILSRIKPHNKKFEDDLWCQMYELGYRTLNYDENFRLPYGKEAEEKKQIDVIAINEETAIIIECKSCEKPTRAPSYKDEFELLSLRLDGFRKTLMQAFDCNIKVKYIFATRNIRLETDSSDVKLLEKTHSYYYNDNSYKYINNLVKSYKNAAHYQFTGLIFKNQLISTERIEIPAIEGDMGNKKYYMFSLEPELLLKMGFVLHKTRSIEDEIPNYQRLLVPSRLANITKFIDSGGYFPNSIIINFSQKKHSLQFEAGSKKEDSNSRFGTLKIPNAYSIAYIIDGQHRLYGYANSKYKASNTIPVVAFADLDPKDQLEIFMDINQNQKAVSPSLRLMLGEDLFWNAPRTDSRLIALRSSIIRELSESQTSPLYNKIEIGADPAILSAKPFEKAISDSNLLPKAKGNKYVEETIVGSLYNTSNLDHNSEMIKTKKRVVQLICLCYEFVESNYPSIYEKEKYFILSNRGTYAFVTLIGSLNKFLTEKGILNTDSIPKERFEGIEKYLASLLEHFKSINKEEEQKLLSHLGSTADLKWLRHFQMIINSYFNEYKPIELVDWMERQDEALQDEGRKYGVAIEKHMKKIVLQNIKLLFKENWELEINSIKRECLKRAEEEKERNYKEGLTPKEIHWTEMFNIFDYKDIIKKYWTKTPAENLNPIDNFKTFQQEFSIDIGEGFNSTAERIKWISRFNSYRNMWAHEGTKEKRLNREEVKFLEMIYSHFYK